MSRILPGVLRKTAIGFQTEEISATMPICGRARVGLDGLSGVLKILCDKYGDRNIF